MDWGAYGIFSSYCRASRIAHNLVEQQPYSGICPCFTWFAFPSKRDEQVRVEHNHVHHVMLKLHDGGAIHTKDGVAKSSSIRGNLLHDVGGSRENNGLFLDDGSYGFHIEDNIIYGATQAVRFNNTSREKFTWGKNLPKFHLPETSLQGGARCVCLGRHVTCGHWQFGLS